ncbi:MAG: hypothetical protein V4641_05605 [Pseudomonadota bacterium]
MSASPDDEITLDFKGGVNNLAEQTAMPSGTARAIINLDLVSGVPSLREGRQLRYPSASTYSLWSHPMLTFGLFMEADALKLLHESMQVDVLRSGLQTRDRHYAFVNNRVYHSNGVDTGIVTQDGVLRPWGVECPADTYTLTASAGGGLPGGEYRVALTFLRGNEEGGAFEPQTVVLIEGHGITVGALPAPVDTSITALRVYASSADDPRLFHVRDVAIGMPSVSIGAGGRGRRLDTVGLLPAPPGQYLLAKNSRLFSGSGRLLRWTESLRYGLTDPVNNVMPMPEDITGLGAPSDEALTLYVGGVNKTFLLQGTDMADVKLRSVMHTGIVPGSLLHIDPEDLNLQGVTDRCPVWLGSDGLFYVGTSTSRIPLNQGVAATIYQKAAAAFVEIEGRQRLIVAGRGGRKADLAIKDRAVARVVP